MERRSEVPVDHPGVVVPPPLIYIIFLLIGVALQRFWPLPLLPISVARAMATILVVLWVALQAWSISRFRASRTSMIPVRPARALVIEGPYRLTRNPMYLGLLLLYAGIACWFGFVWPLIVAPVLVWVVNAYVIAREERYLDRKFGEQYRRYKAQVRRWV